MSACSSVQTNRKPTDVNSTANALYETVNALPQFADGEDHFLFYWAIWRGLSEQEKGVLGDAEGALISLRDIRWQVLDCQNGTELNQDGEKIWYWDAIKLNSQGLVSPIKEAPRNGYRYFNMLNVNSQHLRGAGPFKAPKKQRGEKMEEWDKRRHRAFLEWLKQSTAKNTKGSIGVEAEHRLFSKQILNSQDAWVHPQDYPKLTGDLLEKITRYSPSRWPIFFDERAHKPHLFSEPKSWQDPHVISQNQFRMKLAWDWCEPNQPVKVEVFVPKGELPPPGPNRPGRTDSGKNHVKITEIDWPR